MSFLTGLLADLVEWGIGKIYSWAKALVTKLENRSANQAAAAASVQPIKDANTGAQIDSATNSDLNGL